MAQQVEECFLDLAPDLIIEFKPEVMTVLFLITQLIFERLLTFVALMTVFLNKIPAKVFAFVDVRSPHKPITTLLMKRIYIDERMS